MKAHTSGPWTLQNEGNFFKIFSSDKSKCSIAHTKGSYSLKYKEIEANANLIAAAPELLEALEDLIKGFDLKMGKSAIQIRIDMAKSAIAKAKGE